MPAGGGWPPGKGAGVRGEGVSRMIELLAELVRIESVSGNEARIAAFVQQQLESCGLRVQGDGRNVWTELGAGRGPRLLLNSHLDTVPPAADWPHDPWQPRIEGERISGLGANDAKGCVCAMLEAVRRLKQRLDGGAWPGGSVVLALTCEEETTGAGLSETLPKLGPIDAAIVGEPTSLVPMIAQRGLLIVRVEHRGAAAHPANVTPREAVNAIERAADDLVRLRAFDWGPEHPLLGRPHGHVTKIEGGRALNAIPDACRFWIDIRTTPAEGHEALIERLRGHLRGQVCVHSQRLEPVETPADAAIVQAVLRALPGRRPAGSATMSDMVFLRGIPAVKIGPGDSARSHTAGEYVTRPELEAGASAYERIVLEYLGRQASKGC